MTKTRLKNLLSSSAQKVEVAMDVLLPKPVGIEQPLIDAMRYSTLGGGKRLRAFMVLQSARLFDVEEAQALRVGAAVEFLHSYSLIHDDLPAMDDSDLRRGKASCHKEFDEVTAILAGDALQSLAFEVLIAEETHDNPLVRCQLASALASAAGASGMVAGQMMDLVAESISLPVNQVIRLQNLKTGEMFSFSASAGAIMAGVSQIKKDALKKYAEGFGLAFQITDDLLDLEGDAISMGKPVGQDAAAHKATLVSILGVEQAKYKAECLIDASISALDPWGEKAEVFKDLARYVLNRTD
jgi:farnesyl diphosphate synthase